MPPTMEGAPSPLLPLAAAAPAPAAIPVASLQPGSILLLLPPNYPSLAALPGELASSATLEALKTKFLGMLPGYSLHALLAKPFLPKLPPSLSYKSVEGNVLAIMDKSALADNSLQFETTVIGYPSTFNSSFIVNSLTSAPADFTAPTNLPNYTFTGLNAGASIPSLASGFR